MIGKVITDLEDVHGALTWLLLQMDERYRLFREYKVRNIEAFNRLARRRKKLDTLPHIVLIVDELADLMMTAPEEIEKQLVRLAQMARATGIHLVLATQRPSTDVVTGLIKANFPSRIAFAVTSQIDSRVILDSPGAEKLLGQGDMLLMRADKAKIQRVQGSYVNDSEIKRVVDWWLERDGQENTDRPAARVAPWIGLLDRLDDDEELLAEAIDAIRGEEAISASFVQQELQIGYPRAAQLVKILESKGLVGADPAGGNRRKVLLKTAAETGEEDGALEQA
jgi:S-DNA-T family DNA segregation ATPase FtsK/SpoIIIE